MICIKSITFFYSFEQGEKVKIRVAVKTLKTSDDHAIANKEIMDVSTHTPHFAVIEYFAYQLFIPNISFHYI